MARFLLVILLLFVDATAKAAPVVESMREGGATLNAERCCCCERGKCMCGCRRGSERKETTPDRSATCICQKQTSLPSAPLKLELPALVVFIGLDGAAAVESSAHVKAVRRSCDGHDPPRRLPSTIILLI